MQFSTSTEYAVHGLIYLAIAPVGKAALLSEIAGAIKVPENYLRKVFLSLSRRGVVVSRRGVNGGYHLARRPEHISLKEVVEAINGSLPMYHCLKIKRKCTIEEDCPVKGAFDEARIRMAEVLQGTSLKDLAAKIDSTTDKAGWLKIST